MGKIDFTDFFPVLKWFPAFLKNPGKTIGGDIVAGFTVGVLIMPQAIAYADLAHLPPVQGLYSSLVPMIIYFFFGTSRQLSVGPVSMVSLSIGSAVAALEQEEAVKYAVVVNFFVGIVYVIMGFVRLGRIIDYIQTPIISGFTSAAAFIVIAGQVSPFFGLQIANPDKENTFILLLQSIKAIGTTRIVPCTMALLSLAANFFIVKRFPSLPSSLIITITTALITWIIYLLTESSSCGGAMFYFFETFGGTLIPETAASANLTTHMTKNRFLALDSDHVDKYTQQYLPVIGSLKPGLPEFHIPKATDFQFGMITPIILVILLGFMESISITKKYSEILNYPVSNNQELIALGCANFAGSFFQCYSVTGSFSRTAVNAKSGARTPIASLITAALVALFLYGFTFLLYYVPKCTLAVILMLAVYGLIDVKLIKNYIKHKKWMELSFFLAVFLATFCFNTTWGLIVGTILNLVHIYIKKRRGEPITEEDNKKEPIIQSTELIRGPDDEDLMDNEDSSAEQRSRLIVEPGTSTDSKDVEEIEMQKL